MKFAKFFKNNNFDEQLQTTASAKASWEKINMLDHSLINKDDVAIPEALL